MDILEIVRKASNSLGTFIQELVEAWRRGDRFRVLVVGFIVSLIFCASQQEWLKKNIPLLKDVPQLLNQTWLNIFWVLAGILLLWAIYESVRIKPRPSTELPQSKEREAIKGLRPFTEADREIFKQLQRNRALQDCLAEINRDNFRFGILFGESGCGKTSFIQAGLISQLSQPDSKVQGIYVRFSDRDPIATIRQAFVEKLPLFPEDVSQVDFLTLLSLGVEAASKPLVLIFDQFEQFFVHFKRKEDRQFFVKALADWYSHPEPPKVKILVSIRKDFFAYLMELQKAFGDSYSLSPMEVIELEKFSPEEATNVMEVIAKTESLEFDRHFIQEVAEQELASREDSLISPVDLQVLAWIINGQKASELRAFNKKAFQKLGGIEGLLTKFLERTLQVRVTEAQRQATVKVLLGLTDLERQVRAGILSFRELQAKLPNLSASAIEETVTWLAGGDVRLITPIEREGVTGYELAHERMIPALMKLAGKELSEADRANQLLDRRVNEWLGNNRNPRFLLGWGELWLIQKEKPYLVWGANRRHKERLLSASKRRFQLLFSGVIGFLAIVGLLWLGTGYLLSTPKGQIQQVRWELGTISQRVDSNRAAVEAAVAFAKDGDLRKALEIIEGQIDNSRYKAEALRAIAEAVSKLNQPQKAAELLDKALASADRIDYSYAKTWALRAIAEAYSKLNQPQKAAQLLDKALTSADRIDSSSNKASALRAIAEAYSQLNQPERAADLLEKALASADQIDSSSDKARALRAIAEAQAKLNNWGKARQASEKITIQDDKVKSLAQVLTIWAEKQHPELVEKQEE